MADCDIDRLEDYFLALSDYDMVIFLEQTAQDYVNRGETHYKSGQSKQAEDDFTTAIERSPSDAYAISRRGRFYRETRQYDRAVEDYIKAIKLVPTASRYSNLARAYFGLKEYLSAIDNYSKAIEYGPTEARYFNRGLVYRKLGDHKKAVEDFSKTLKMNPAHQKAETFREKCLDILGR